MHGFFRHAEKTSGAKKKIWVVAVAHAACLSVPGCPTCCSEHSEHKAPSNAKNFHQKTPDQTRVSQCSAPLIFRAQQGHLPAQLSGGLGQNNQPQQQSFFLPQQQAQLHQQQQQLQQQQQPHQVQPNVVLPNNGFIPNFPQQQPRQAVGQPSQQPRTDATQSFDPDHDPMPNNLAVQFFGAPGRPGSNTGQALFTPRQDLTGGQATQFADPFGGQQQPAQFQPPQMGNGPFVSQASQQQTDFNGQQNPFLQSQQPQNADPFAGQQKQPQQQPQQQQQSSAFGQPTSEQPIFQQANLPQNQFSQFLTPEQQQQLAGSQQNGQQAAAASFQDPAQTPFNPQFDQSALNNVMQQSQPQQILPQFDQTSGQQFIPADAAAAQQQQQQQQQAPRSVGSDGFFIPQQPTIPAARSDTAQSINQPLTSGDNSMQDTQPAARADTGGTGTGGGGPRMR